MGTFTNFQGTQQPQPQQLLRTPPQHIPQQQLLQPRQLQLPQLPPTQPLLIQQPLHTQQLPTQQPPPQQQPQHGTNLRNTQQRRHIIQPTVDMRGPMKQK